jgi:hypothetical protein
VRLDGLGQLQNPVTSSGIERTTFRVTNSHRFLCKGGGLRTWKSVKISCSLFPVRLHVYRRRCGVYSGQYRAAPSAESSEREAPSGDKQRKVKKQRRRNANRLCGCEGEEYCLQEGDSVYSGTLPNYTASHVSKCFRCIQANAEVVHRLLLNPFQFIIH